MMKHLIIPTMLFAVILAGCSSGGKELTIKPAPEQTAAPQPTAVPVAEGKTEEVVKQMQLLASQAQEPRELTSFMDKHWSTADAKTADSLFLALEAFDVRQLPALNANLSKLLQQPGAADKLSELSYPFDFSKLKGDDAFKQWLLNQTAGKLALGVTFDNSFYWAIDYDALQKAYGARLSEELKLYLASRAAEYNKPFFQDGGLKITRTELGNRLLQAENYLTRYPGGARKTEMKALYTDYMEEYIRGYRYEAIDEKTMKLLPAVKQSYEQLVKEHPDTKTAAIVKAYLEEINRNKDVIYQPGKQGMSIIGGPLPNISGFWDGLAKRIDQAF
ncbi:hypothetical protein ACFQ88_29290 [Paenibacillus sp. NPDC056579]|uniref:hypothetical protein n=1 Tax=Paenibacillus sp. NPDC056579 TaxID=3345871 RepID=UPI00368EA5D5